MQARLDAQPDALYCGCRLVNPIIKSQTRGVHQNETHGQAGEATHRPTREKIAMNFDTNYNTTEGKRETGGGHGSLLGD